MLLHRLCLETHKSYKLFINLAGRKLLVLPWQASLEVPGSLSAAQHLSKKEKTDTMIYKD